MPGRIVLSDLVIPSIWKMRLSSRKAEARQAAARYRCRVRLIRSLADSRISVRTFDEIYVDPDHGVVRNNFALGFGAQMGSALTLELYHVWVDNLETRNDNYALVLLTLRL